MPTSVLNNSEVGLCIFEIHTLPFTIKASITPGFKALSIPKGTNALYEASDKTGINIG